MKNKCILIYDKERRLILSKCIEDGSETILATSVKNCTIFNNGQDCRYLIAIATDPWTHHIILYPDGTYEFKQR